MSKEITNNNTVNLLCEGTEITGDLKTKGDLRVDGKVNGKIITSGRLIVGSNAEINGDIECTNVDVFGMVNGNILSAGTVTLKSTARMVGNISTPVFVAEQGILFNGNCKMESKGQPSKK